jgi:hypothetical protein
MIDGDRLESFIGYGNRDAPVVFIGIEEGLSDVSALVADLSSRSQFECIMDLHEAHVGLADVQKLFGDNAKTQRTWRPMCHVMLRRAGIERPTLKERKRYQGNELGRRDGQTLIAELLPYPSKKQARDSAAWPYGGLCRFQTYKQYRSELLQKRKDLLVNELSRVSRKLIVCYGKSEWNEYMDLFQIINWVDDGVYRLGAWLDSRVVLTDHLSSRTFNTEEQLQQFVDVVLSGSILPASIAKRPIV